MKASSKALLEMAAALWSSVALDDVDPLLADVRSRCMDATMNDPAGPELVNPLTSLMHGTAQASAGVLVEVLE